MLDEHSLFAEIHGVAEVECFDAHLFENGDVLAIHEGLGIVKLDSSSEVLWARTYRVHHDLDVLDEPTASLDARTELELRRSKTQKRRLEQSIILEVRRAARDLPPAPETPEPSRE